MLQVSNLAFFGDLGSATALDSYAVWIVWGCLIGLRPEECLPSPRCFHSLRYGTFGTGGPALVLYGGLGRDGSVLDDLWLTFTERYWFTMPFFLRLDGWSESWFEFDFFATHIEKVAQSAGLGCADGLLNRTTDVRVEKGPSYIEVFFLAEFVDYLQCYVAVASWDAIFSGTPLQAFALSSFETDGSRSDTFTRVRVTNNQYTSSRTCRNFCFKALCQGDVGGPNEGMSERRADGRLRFCNKEEPACGAGYSCSLPGGRHGHSSETVEVDGAGMSLLLFGGDQVRALAALHMMPPRWRLCFHPTSTQSLS